MAKVQKNRERWVRPWNMTKFDDLFNRDERYFSVLLKGVLSWFNNNMMMYDKPINHFIFTTGSSYMYIESNGYEFKWNETSGEDWMYMQLPRCVVEIASIHIPTEELTAPYVRGNYERRDGDNIRGFNAQIRRLPIEMDLTMRYEFSNFNESIIFIQEALDKLLFQRYFRISYLGQIIKCSIELPQDFNIQINPIDMTSTDPKQRTIELSVKINSNYPLIDETTEIPTDKVIAGFGSGTSFEEWSKKHPVKIIDSLGEEFYVSCSDGYFVVHKLKHKETGEVINYTDDYDNNLYEDIYENIDLDSLVNEFGEPMTPKEMYEAFNFNPLGAYSTLFSGDITNTTDILPNIVIRKN